MSFNEIILDIKAREEEYLQLRSKVSGIMLERSIDNILNRIYDDIKKIIELKGEIYNEISI